MYAPIWRRKSFRTSPASERNGSLGGLQPVLVWGIVAGNVILKYIATVVGLPLICTVRKRSDVLEECGEQG